MRLFVFLPKTHKVIEPRQPQSNQTPSIWFLCLSSQREIPKTSTCLNTLGPKLNFLTKICKTKPLWSDPLGNHSLQISLLKLWYQALYSLFLVCFLDPTQLFTASGPLSSLFPLLPPSPSSGFLFFFLVFQVFVLMSPWKGILWTVGRK